MKTFKYISRLVLVALLSIILVFVIAFVFRILRVEKETKIIKSTHFDVTFNGEWIPWIKKVPSVSIETHMVDQTDLIIPTVDTLRHEDLLYSWLSEHKPVILCGPPGSGKTMSLFSSLRKLPELEVVGVNFSSSTTPGRSPRSWPAPWIASRRRWTTRRSPPPS